MFKIIFFLFCFRRTIFCLGIFGGLVLLGIFITIQHVPLGNASAIFFSTPGLRSRSNYKVKQDSRDFSSKVPKLLKRIVKELQGIPRNSKDIWKCSRTTLKWMQSSFECSGSLHGAFYCTQLQVITAFSALTCMLLPLH